MITTHPTDARYFSSRKQARAAKRQSEKIVRLGRFAGGSFGCYPPIKENGLYVGQVPNGPIPMITVWMTTKKG